MSGKGLVVGMVVGFVAIWVVSGTAEAMSGSCGAASKIQVESDSLEDIDLICGAAPEAIAFLGKYGIECQDKLVIHVTEAVITAEGHQAFGSYDRIRDHILIMSLAAIKRVDPPARMYGQLLDRDHYRGVVAHEVAHAVVQRNMTEIPISQVTQEYLAHATQLAVLDPERRQRIIAAVAVDPWQSGDVISDAYMAMEPTRFAVKSYLHLISMDHPEPFITMLLGSKWFFISVP